MNTSSCQFRIIGCVREIGGIPTELADLKVDVIVAFGSKAVLAAKRATTTIPIVDPVMTDPAALGLGTSLAHPSGNITGIAQFGPEAASKRAEFLKEALPRVTRVAVLVNPADASIAVDLNAMRDTAKALKLELQVIEAQSPTDFRQAFSTMAQRHIEAIVVSAYPISGQRSRDLGPCD